MKNYQNQINIQLKHLISLSRQNYVLRQNQDVIKSNDIFVQHLQDVVNHLANAGETLESHSFEMIEQMSNCINNTATASVSMDYSRDVMKKKRAYMYKPLKFKCNKCTDFFNDKSSLNNHQTVHLNLSYSCIKCNKVLYSHQSFVNHLSIHKTGEHVCQQCHKSFSLKTTLTNHLCVHNNTTDICKSCTTKFQRRAKYLKHVEKCTMSMSSNIEEDIINFDAFLVEYKVRYCYLFKRSHIGCNFFKKKKDSEIQTMTVLMHYYCSIFKKIEDL